MSDNKIKRIQSDIVNRITTLSAILMLLPLLAALSKWIEIGWQQIYIPHIILYNLVLLIFIFRKKLSTNVKLNGLIIIYAITGLTGLYSSAFSGVYIFIVLSISFLTILSNRKLSLLYISIFLICFILIAIGYITGRINTQVNLTLFSHSFTQWITHSLSLLSFIIIFIGGFKRYYTELLKTIDDKSKIEAELIRQNTEYFKAIQYAEENEHRLLTFINSIPDIVCYKDGQGRWLLANEADLKLFSLEGVDYVGKTDKELAKYTHSIYREAFERCIVSDENAWKNKKLSRGIEVVPTESGQDKTYEIYKIPLFYENGERKGLAVIGRDITILKNTEHELLLAKEHAEKSDKLKTAFLNNMSHEIRTPMNGIIGFSKMLTDPNRSQEEKKQFSNIIVKSSEQLLQLVNDILDIAKIEANEIKLHEEEINMQDFCKEIMSLYSLQAENKGLKLKAEKSDLVQETIIADKHKLQQIINNLLSNAIKFTDSGSIEISCLKKKKQLLFSVRDSGIGIKDEFHESIFDRFQQADIESNQHSGTGLGLAICKGLITIMKGKIWVESELNKGSTFYFTLPYEPVIKLNKKESILKNKKNDYNEVSILIAEDEDINYLYISELLKPKGINLIRAKNGQDAIDVVNNNGINIDLILMDIKMPKMNGLEASTKIRNAGFNIPIIALTAHAFSEDKEKALTSGCDDFISKPINEEILLQCIDKYLKK